MAPQRKTCNLCSNTSILRMKKSHLCLLWLLLLKRSIQVIHWCGIHKIMFKLMVSLEQMQRATIAMMCAHVVRHEGPSKITFISWIYFSFPHHLSKSSCIHNLYTIRSWINLQDGFTNMRSTVENSYSKI